MGSHLSPKRPGAGRTDGRPKASELSLEDFRMSKHPALKRIAKRAAQNKRLSAYSSKFLDRISF
jgi:hypothetical protein